MGLIVSTGPHLRDKDNVPQIMRDVLLALLPAVVGSVIFFGLRALFLCLISMLTAMLTEFLCKKMRGQKSTLTDGSAALTGLLLAMCVPPSLPYWMAALGCVVAIGVAKEAFGGLGFNIFNPAHVGRAFLLAAYPVAMTTWHQPFTNLTVTTATPLNIIKEKLVVEFPSLWNLFLGNRAGSLGETSALLLLIGAAYLFYKKIIDWRIPFVYIGTVALLMFVFRQDPLIQVLSGGLLIGAFFMATDYVTSPITTWGKIGFGIGAGLLVVVIRLWGGYPEGVCYSILVMNAFTPLLDKLGPRA
jgi:electron transport complex protein RnfD